MQWQHEGETDHKNLKKPNWLKDINQISRRSANFIHERNVNSAIKLLSNDM